MNIPDENNPVRESIYRGLPPIGMGLQWCSYSARQLDILVGLSIYRADAEEYARSVFEGFREQEDAWEPVRGLPVAALWNGGTLVARQRHMIVAISMGSGQEPALERAKLLVQAALAG